jgi:two-component system phosphate regulon response regulator PhoB
VATILVLNDEPDLIYACRLVLEADGHTVIATTNATEALRLAAQTQPDMVLLDWVMPTMTGDEVLRRLRKMPETAATPVVMMSALPNGDVLSKATGADAFLAKPFSLSELSKMINRFAGTS